MLNQDFSLLARQSLSQEWKKSILNQAMARFPGTDAYNMRVEDAQPDQIAVMPEDESTKPEKPSN